MLSRKALSLTPYTAGEQPSAGGYIKLNTNENPYPPSKAAMDVLTGFDAEKLRLYPDPDAKELAAAIAAYEGVEPKNIFLGNGSDEVLAFAFAALFDKAVSFADVTYSFYPVYCNLYGLKKNVIPLTVDYGLDLTKYKSAKGGIVIANPNAPTSVSHAPEELLELVKSVPCNVLLDEAYIDFSVKAASLAKTAPALSNLLVVKTMSKSYSLAGLRCGYAVGCEELIGGLYRMKNCFNSYPLDRICQAVAKAAILDRAYFDQTVAAVQKTRRRTAAALKEAGHTVLDSDANFLFIRHKTVGGAEAYRALKDQRILVRHFPQPRTKDFIRVTVGTDADTEKFIQAFNAL